MDKLIINDKLSIIGVIIYAEDEKNTYHILVEH